MNWGDLGLQEDRGLTLRVELSWLEGQTKGALMHTGYQFKITLRHAQPPVWRRFWVPDSITLDEFHAIIQEVMGWENCHLHAFQIGGKEYGIPDPEFESPTIDERYVVLKSVIQKKGQKIHYEYDFGDGWEHEIVLEDRAQRESDVPVVLAGERACPPEDCGGIPGYEHLLKVLGKKRHSKDERELLEWVGEDYDPEEYELEAINAELAEGLEELDQEWAGDSGMIQFDPVPRTSTQEAAPPAPDAIEVMRVWFTPDDQIHADLNPGLGMEPQRCGGVLATLAMMIAHDAAKGPERIQVLKEIEKGFVNAVRNPWREQ